jgi:Putative transposase/Transposase zinc-binding domain
VVLAPAYEPRDPQQAVLAPLVRQWWPRHLESVEADGGTVAAFVRRAVDHFLACGDPNAGFITLKCPACGAECALAFSCKGRGLCPSCGARRMHDVAHHLVTRVLPAVPVRQYVLSPPSELVALLAARGEALSALSRIFVESVFSGIRKRSGPKLSCGSVVVFQRFNKALTVYPHLHVLVLDGGYVEHEDGALDFVDDTTPAPIDLRKIEARVEERFTRWLKRHGFVEEDEPPKARPDDGWWSAAAHEPSGLLAPVERKRNFGFEVHAAVRVAAEDETGRARLCRYVMRPPLAQAQLKLIDDERVRLTFRNPTRSGQRSIDLHPLALMRRLAWLVPPPRQHQIRYTGVLAPAARLRPAVVPAGRVGVQRVWFGDRAFVPAKPVPYREHWARLLARVYDVDAQQCPNCCGRLTPVGAVLPPRSAARLEHGRILVLPPTGPPAQLPLPLATA